jgi:hypothetical protein
MGCLLGRSEASSRGLGDRRQPFIAKRSTKRSHRAMKKQASLGLVLVVVAACGGSVETNGGGDAGVEDVGGGTRGGSDATAKDTGGGRRGGSDSAVQDAGPPPVCTMPADLTGDAARASGCYASRALIECDNVGGGCSELCMSNDLTTCPDSGLPAPSCGSSSGPDTMPETCSDQCAAGEYAVTCDIPEDGGDAPSPPADCRSIDPPAESAEATYSCCPCGS